MSVDVSPLSLEEISKCIHCGICLPECPTYALTGLEAESPRGRVHLARAVSDGRIEPGVVFADHMYLCLGCRACETACPTGVGFGHILENAREMVGPPGTGIGGLLTRLFLTRVIGHPARLRVLARALGLYRSTGLKALIERLLPARFTGLSSMAPEVPAEPFPKGAMTLPPHGEKRYTVGLLSGCIMSVLFPGVNEATVSVLRRNGCEVVVPGAQGCCGALNLHYGLVASAMAMARGSIDAFGGERLDAIVVNSAGCGSAMKEYGTLLAGDADYAEGARELSAKVRDVSEFLAGIGIERPKGALGLSLTYQDPCHLVHGQGISREPRELIEALDGVELREMTNPSRCCGSAGIYNIIQPGMSARILDEKIDDIARTGTDAVVAPNPGCMIQIGNGLANRGLDVEVLHIVELLERAYEAGGETP